MKCGKLSSLALSLLHSEPRCWHLRCYSAEWSTVLRTPSSPKAKWWERYFRQKMFHLVYGLDSGQQCTWLFHGLLSALFAWLHFQFPGDVSSELTNRTIIEEINDCHSVCGVIVECITKREYPLFPPRFAHRYFHCQRRRNNRLSNSTLIDRVLTALQTLWSKRHWRRYET